MSCAARGALSAIIPYRLCITPIPAPEALARPKTSLLALPKTRPFRENSAGVLILFSSLQDLEFTASFQFTVETVTFKHERGTRPNTCETRNAKRAETQRRRRGLYDSNRKHHGEMKRISADLAYGQRESARLSSARRR